MTAKSAGKRRKNEIASVLNLDPTKKKISMMKIGNCSRKIWALILSKNGKESGWILGLRIRFLRAKAWVKTGMKFRNLKVRSGIAQ